MATEGRTISTKDNLQQIVTRGTGGGQASTYTTSAKNESYISWSRTSSRTPGFHSPNRVGRLLPLPFSFSRTEDRYGKGYWISEDTSYRPTSTQYTKNEQMGCFGSFYAPNNATTLVNKDDVLFSKLRDQANQKLLGKIKNTSANFAVAYAEAGQTARMVGDTAIKLAKAMRNLRRGNFVEAAEALGAVSRKRARSRFNKQYAKDVSNAVASGWLELQYGWKPLIDDVYGACDQLARRHLNDAIITSRASQTRVTPLRAVSATKYGSALSQYVAFGEARSQVTVSVSYKRPGKSSAVTLKETGVLNPALIAWELVPYSFVVDWFLPIGNWLDTFDATVGLTFHSGYRTEYHKAGCEFVYTYLGKDNYGVQQNARIVSSNSNIKVDRVILGSFPSPGIPRFTNPVSTGHMLNGLALLTQLFRK